jgi:hypothetical protein
MHAWAHARKWHPAFIWPVYILFVTPLTWVAIFGLSAVGLLDNVFELRAGARAETQTGVSERWKSFFWKKSIMSAASAIV